MYLKIFNQILEHSFEHTTEFLLEDGAVAAETSRRLLII